MPKATAKKAASDDAKSAQVPAVTDFDVLTPSVQIDFYTRLQAVRKLHLHEALKNTLADSAFDLAALDVDLAEFVDSKHLKRLATFGLRGENFFAVPYLIERNPYLLGYYRLLYGFSCKAFYDQGPFGRFRAFEGSGKVRAGLEANIPALCHSLCATAGVLLEMIEPVSASIINELQILTLGAQFKGSGNVSVGTKATDAVFDLLKALLVHYAPTIKKRTISFKNDSGLPVTIRFGSDPDVSVTQELQSEQRALVAIEIKGGLDGSNIWNRLGEAEKSHSKAKANGFNELWTITRVDLTGAPATLKKARGQSESTTRFWCLSRILDASTQEAALFRQVFGSLLGVKLTV